MKYFLVQSLFLCLTCFLFSCAEEKKEAVQTEVSVKEAFLIKKQM
jgi:hypothetical protein